MKSLWGDDFVVEDSKETAKKVINKTKKAKEISVEKAIDSKSIPLAEKIALIDTEVHRILGKFEKDTLVIRDKQTFVNYIDNAIAAGIIAIDTETNNSLDPLTCKLMGPCIFTPGQKQAYIPINHTDSTGTLLSNQLTEADVKEQFARLTATKIIMHNAKFDKQVIYCTCGIMLDVYWDTLLGAQMLNENEMASLKSQYISKIDPSIEKYDIEHLFKVPYNFVPPELFALYAATDAKLTYALYEYQVEQFALPDNDRIYDIFKNVEMKVLPVFTSMELTGISIDTDYCNRLTPKYHAMMDAEHDNVYKALDKYKDKISNWRVSADATAKPKQYPSEAELDTINKYEVHKSDNEFILKNPGIVENYSKLIKKYNCKDSSGKIYKEGKSKAEQLSDPIELTSPSQLAILIYDILKIQPVDKKQPRGTGEAILEQINEPFCKALVAYKKFVKLITSFIDTLPTQLSPADNKIHCNHKQLGTVTGRVSCSNPNLQQIPSKNHEIRMMFCASTADSDIEFDDSFEVYEKDEVLLSTGKYVEADHLSIGNTLEDGSVIKSIIKKDRHLIISCA